MNIHILIRTSSLMVALLLMSTLTWAEKSPFAFGSTLTITNYTNSPKDLRGTLLENELWGKEVKQKEGIWRIEPSSDLTISLDKIFFEEMGNLGIGTVMRFYGESFSFIIGYDSQALKIQTTLFNEPYEMQKEIRIHDPVRIELIIEANKDIEWQVKQFKGLHEAIIRTKPTGSQQFEAEKLLRYKRQ